MVAEQRVRQKRSSYMNRLAWAALSAQIRLIKYVRVL